MNRKKFIRTSAVATAGLITTGFRIKNPANEFPVVRVAENLRKFKSPAVEKLISTIQKQVANKEIAWLFNNCFPNTLDTTVEFEMINGKPDTFVITGDIDAMWLRDSSAQVWPYLPLMKEDKKLQDLIRGVINRQVKCILKDPYANAFYKDESKISEWKDDKTDMKPGIHERKWEIDSLCYPIRLSYGYWKESGDSSPFDNDWKQAMRLILQTFREQQRLTGNGPYRFERTTSWATDGVPLGGYGYPTKKNGLIHSMFRPSDDATIYPYLVPSNFFAYFSLFSLEEMMKSFFNETASRNQLVELVGNLRRVLFMSVLSAANEPAKVIPYEINGAGSTNLMDDANVPSLLSLPYLTPMSVKDRDYVRTRAFIHSSENPFFFSGKAGEGVGGPHIGMDYIWPMSIIMRGLTSTDEKEIKKCMDMLQKTHAGTGFMHESFHKDDPSKFTRKWFAWANTLFGEFVWKVVKEKKELLD
jgi:uncharacterized protein